MPTPQKLKIEFEPTRVEIYAPRRTGPRKGRPAYRWVDGLYVIVDGKKHFPPLPTWKAKAYARALVAEGRTPPCAKESR